MIKDGAAPDLSMASDPSAAAVLLAPVAGRVVPISEVPDPAFSSGMLGQGLAIWPEEGLVRASAAGVVAVAMPHAVCVATASGLEVLVHAGIDTVTLGADGFEALVVRGNRVEASEPLLRMDLRRVEAAGLAECVVVAVGGAGAPGPAELLVAAGARVAAGDAVLRVALR